MASLADFRNGLCIEFNDQIFQIVSFQHVKPGKGPAFVRAVQKLQPFVLREGLTNISTTMRQVTIS